MKIIICGYCGHLGREVAALTEKGYRGASLFCGVDVGFTGEPDGICYKSLKEVPDGADCIVDFSHHSATEELLNYAVSKKLPLVLATTGQTEEEKAMILDASKKIPLFFAANYSIGVALLIELAKKAAAALPEAEIEIVEQHHSRKVDAPSGTALAIGNALKEVRPEAQLVCGRSGYGKRNFNEIGISSVRMGNIVGVHEVMIGTKNQTISLKHEAFDRAMFAEGAVAAAAFLVDKEAGLYDMKSMCSFE